MNAADFIAINRAYRHRADPEFIAACCYYHFALKVIIFRLYFYTLPAGAVNHSEAALGVRHLDSRQSAEYAARSSAKASV